MFNFLERVELQSCLFLSFLLHYTKIISICFEFGCWLDLRLLSQELQLAFFTNCMLQNVLLVLPLFCQMLLHQLLRQDHMAEVGY